MQKNKYIDFIKGIAIFLVLFGHAIQYGSGNVFIAKDLAWDDCVMKTIYSFHMPLFIAISGYLYYFSTERHGAKKAFGKRVEKLLPICMTWALILSIREWILNSKISIVLLIKNFLTDFWFLWAVVICALCVSIIESLYEGKLNAGGQKIQDYILHSYNGINGNYPRCIVVKLL